MKFPREILFDTIRFSVKRTQQRQPKHLKRSWEKTRKRKKKMPGNFYGKIVFNPTVCGA
jgi:hypothetical protein